MVFGALVPWPFDLTIDMPSHLCLCRSRWRCRSLCRHTRRHFQLQLQRQLHLHLINMRDIRISLSLDNLDFICARQISNAKRRTHSGDKFSLEFRKKTSTKTKTNTKTQAKTEPEPKPNQNQNRNQNKNKIKQCQFILNENTRGSPRVFYGNCKSV